MNTNRLLAGALALSSIFMLGACGEKQSGDTVKAGQVNSSDVTFPIAYVRMDSVLSQYTYSKEVQAKLEADADAGRSRLQGKAMAFQKAAEDFDRRLRINAFVSEDAAKTEQARVLRMQQEAAGLEQQLSGELAQKSALMQEDLMKKIQEELKLFNGGRYKLILSNATVLYVDEAMDITEGFIKHLNENYSSSKKAIETEKVK